MLDEKKVWGRLRRVMDPELGVNIVDLGLVYKISVDRGKVMILMTLTTPGCPLAHVFNQLIRKAIRELPGVKGVSIELTFDPPWTSERMSKKAKAQLGFD